MNDNDEILEVFDSSEALVGTIRRGDVIELTPKGGRYIRAVNAFIQRENGDIWVPTRNMNKSIAPGGLDFSVGGHLAPGEDYIDCLLREMVEEASLRISPDDAKLVASYEPDEKSVYFCRTYLIRTNALPIIGEEHVAAEWMTLAGLIDQLRSGVPAKSNLLPEIYDLQKYLSTIDNNN